ncbi:PREDICTED: WASH complex subunit CCDC53-like isoform X1 [Branchiostoma belcheri]|uniref:WASH complex subunit 3 n=1 Tax=Branchiostoma belcheri TaxID=7741 RepID=A0A6P4YUL8_BRABE|nr:PREDICTED: WASH complex subunit CCDC53-like isoform X1 [Branchiostoma belcheri]
MDADGLPLVGPGVDYTKIGAIHQKRMLAFINHFITHTARFLNRFSCVCEEKLANINLRIQRIETTMNILEAKIASIPGLENITGDSAPPSTAGTAGTAVPTGTAPADSTASAQQPAESEAVPEAAAPPPEEAAPAAPTMTVAQDPRYAKYFKMINMGVPVQALKTKVAMEGLDPDLLDTPDAPAPAGAPQEDSDSESASSFTDSD